MIHETLLSFAGVFRVVSHSMKRRGVRDIHPCPQNGRFFFPFFFCFSCFFTGQKESGPEPEKRHTPTHPSFVFWRMPFLGCLKGKPNTEIRGGPNPTLRRRVCFVFFRISPREGVRLRVCPFSRWILQTWLGSGSFGPPLFWGWALRESRGEFLGSGQLLCFVLWAVFSNGRVLF